MKAAAFIPPPMPPRIPDTDEAREALRRLVNKHGEALLKILTWSAEHEAARLQKGGWPTDRLFNPPQSVWEELGRHYAWMDALPPADDGEVEWPDEAEAE